MLPVAASSAAASRRPAVQRPRTGQSRVLQRGRPGLLTSVQSPGAPPAPLAPEDDQESELELSVRPVQGQEQPAAVPQGRAVEGLLPHHWEEHLQTLHAAERRDLRRYIAIVGRINALSGTMAALSDDELAAKTGELRYRIEAAGLGGPDPGSSPVEILSGSGDGSYASPGGSSRERRRAQAAEWRRRGLLGGLPEDVVIEGFAVVREAAHRVLGMRHYDVQLLGGLVLHEGQIAEMRTGEGKTLVATLPAYINALTGRGVHIITVNGYLAQRDAEWIGKVFKFLGLSVGVLSSESSNLAQRIAALACDVTYTTAYDLAFTYLQDNISQFPRDVVIRRPLHFALVDEADSLLIDEAINPFIITGSMLHAQSQGARWMEAVAVARALTHHSVEQLSIGEAEWQDLERQFDCLVRPRYMSADLSNRGMVSAVRTLVERGTVRLCTDESGRLAVAMMNPLGAEPSKKAGGNGASSNLQPNGAGESGSGSKGSERSSSSSGGSSGGGTDGTSNGSAPAAGAAAESAAAERAAEAAPAGAGAEAAKQPICLVLAYVTLPNGPGASGSGKAIADVRLDSAQRVEGELEKHGLQLLPPGQVTQQQLEAAMPAVMWGGSQAWGMSITTALRALHCYIRDMHYIVDRAAKRVVLIDQGTGRERVKSMWQAGVHQAVEAKEGVPVSSENYTTASVSYQSLFGYYRRLAGMTGTGFTEQQEFAETYGLAVLRVPPHRPSVRRDEGMRLFVYEEGRDSALLDLLLQAQQRRQPVLIGTGTVEESAQVYDLIRRKLAYWQERRKLMHQPQVELLNARPETVRREATIIAQAGLPGSVTIATALAGRGTDILLGGNPKGLVQMLLENRLLERLAGPDAGDLANHDCRLPLSNLTLALQDFNEFDALPLEQLGSAAADPARLSAKLALELPAEVCSAYCQLRMALAAVLPEAAADSQPLPPVLPPPIAQNGAAQNGTAASPAQQQQQQQQQLNGQAAATPAAAGSPLPPQRLPFRRNGLGHSKRAAQYAADWLGRQLEAAEMHKAQLRLSDCLKLPGAAAFQEAARRLGDAQQQLAAPSSGDAQLQQLEAALQRFILLQWLWFERMCGMYARQVRAAGGLCVIIASMPDNKRSELQLRGRAGRQGDPGETHLILSLDDPVMAVRNPGLGALPQATFERVRWNGAYTVGGFRSLVRSLEQDVLVEMEFDPRYASYSMLDAEDDAIFCSYKFQLCDQLTPISNKSVEHAIAAFEAHMRRSRNSVREYDHVLDRYRRHIYTMRRVLVQGGAAGRQRLLQSAFQDAARGIVSRLIDADQPPHSWPLLELVQWVEAVVNSCPPGEAGPFNGARWLAQSNVQQQLVQIRVNLHPAETARQLAAALRSGGALPEPQLIDPSPAASQEVGASKWTGQEVSPEEAQKKLEQVPSEAAKKQQEALAADEAAGRAAAAQPRLRERQAAAALRAQLEADGAGSGWADEGAASAVLGDVRGLAPPPQGRYAAAARQLAAWVAEQLAVQQRNRHAILKEWFRAQATTLGGGGVTDVAALDMLRVRERALLTTRLDSLWAGFLEACQRKQREVSMRSFASYNPLEEYELETSELFAQLLLDFKQQAVADVFRDVDLTSLEDAARAAATATVGEEEAAAPAGGRSGSSSVSIASSVRSIDIEAAGAAEDLGALFDRLGLGDRVAAEAERLAAADEAARRARAAAAEAAVNDGVAAAEAAFIACAATSSACCQVVQLAVRVAQEQNAAMRQLGLYTGPSAQELLRKADGLVRDVVACATECLSGPARNSMARWEDVHSALGAWLHADASHDAAAAEKAQRRLRQLREEAEQDQQRARSWAVHATQLAVGIKPMLDQAVALPQQGYSSSSSSSGGASGSATSFVPLVRASEPAAAMLAANEAVVAGLHAALQTLEQAAAEQQAAVQRIQQERGEQQGSGTAVSFAQPDGDDMPDSESVAAGVASFAMLATNLRQSTEQAGQPGQQQQQQAGAQQRQLPGTTDLPSAVLAARGSPQQASSAAIDTVLAQTAGPAHASSGSYDEQAAAAAQLKQQAEQLSPEAASAVSNLLLAALQRKVFGSTSTQEALAQLTPPQEQQQQQPAGEAQPVQQPDQTASDQQRQPEQ